MDLETRLALPVALHAFASRAERFADRNTACVLALWSVLFFAVTGLLASTKLLWADELVTSYVSGLPSIRAIWQALVQGGDAHPPLSFLLVHLSYRLFGRGLLSSRIPFVLAFWAMSLCIFFFVRKRCGSLYGLAAMSLPLVSGAFAYSYEARPYALVMAAVAASLLAWQRSCESYSLWPRLALFAAVLAAVSSHFFGVFIVVPLAAGELVRAWRVRRIDFGIFIAIAAALIPVLFYLPIAQATSHLYFQAAFWARPTFGSVADTYRLFVDLTEPPVLLTILFWSASMGVHGLVAGATPRIPVWERAAVGTLMLFPVYAVAASLTAGAYTERYGLPVSVGLAIGFAFFVWSRAIGRPSLALSFLCVFVAWFVVKQAVVIQHQMAISPGVPFGAAHPFDGRRWVQQARASSLPVVLTNGIFFTQFQAYAPPALNGRLVYLTSPSKAVEAGFSPAGEINVLTVDRLLHALPIASYESFTKTNRRFLLCAKVESEGWLLPYLLKAGARLTLTSQGEGVRLFEVSLDPDHAAR